MLELDHLKDVVKMSNNFKMYLNRTLNDSHATIAKQRKLRDDTFDPGKGREFQGSPSQRRERGA